METLYRTSQMLVFIPADLLGWLHNPRYTTNQDDPSHGRSIGNDGTRLEERLLERGVGKYFGEGQRFKGRSLYH
jgi:hypothetical protein